MTMPMNPDNLKCNISSCDRKGNWPRTIYTGARFLQCLSRELGRPTTQTATYSSLLAGKTSMERCSTQQKCSQRENGLPSPTCLQQHEQITTHQRGWGLYGTDTTILSHICVFNHFVLGGFAEDKKKVQRNIKFRHIS